MRSINKEILKQYLDVNASEKEICEFICESVENNNSNLQDIKNCTYELLLEMFELERENEIMVLLNIEKFLKNSFLSEENSVEITDNVFTCQNETPMLHAFGLKLRPVTDADRQRLKDERDRICQDQEERYNPRCALLKQIREYDKIFLIKNVAKENKCTFYEVSLKDYERHVLDIFNQDFIPKINENRCKFKNIKKDNNIWYVNNPPPTAFWNEWLEFRWLNPKKYKSYMGWGATKLSFDYIEYDNKCSSFSIEILEPEFLVKIGKTWKTNWFGYDQCKLNCVIPEMASSDAVTMVVTILVQLAEKLNTNQVCCVYYPVHNDIIEPIIKYFADFKYKIY